MLQFSKSKGLSVTILIILFIGGIYTCIRLLLPCHGLTGYYLHLPEGENTAFYPVKISQSEIRPGLKKKIFEGFPKGALINETTEDSAINFDWPSEDKKVHTSPFTIEWNGILKIEHHCDYTFILGSDDGSQMFLNGKLIVDNGGPHALIEKRQTVSLEPGFYRFHLRYFDLGGGAVLYLKWKYANIAETTVPLTQFYYESTARDINMADTTLPGVLAIKPNDPIKDTHTVFKKKDAMLAFGNYGILRTYYVNYWDNHRFAPPSGVPNYNIIWRGFIWIPENGTYTFDVNTNGDVFLFIDEKPVIKYYAGNDSRSQVYLNKGWKPVQINYFNTAKCATLNLLWQKPACSKPGIISSRYLTPIENTGFFGSAKVWYAVGFIAAPLFLILGVFLRIRNTARDYVQGYLVYVRQNWGVVALIVIVILGGILRFNNYSVIPPHGDTVDVYQEAWKGYHILHGKGPIAWAPAYFASAYKDEDKKFIQWFGDGFMIVRGHIDHPPLFSIFAGIPPTICGARDYLDCRLTTINIIPVLFSTLTIILVFLVSYKIYKSNTLSVIASLLYATIPLFVAAGRIAKGDCLLALVLITGVLCVLKYTETKNRLYVIFAGLLAGVSYWSKEQGICAILILPLLLSRKGYIKDAAFIAGIGFFIAAGYMLYNYLINPEAFFKIHDLYNKHHMDKTVFNIVVRYINDARLANVSANFGMGYLLWGWFVMVYSIGKRDMIISITTFIFLMTLCALTSFTFSYGWYLLPIYPFMAIAGGLFMRDFISKPDTAKAILMLLVLGAIPLKEIIPEDLHNTPWLFRCYLAIGILPFLASDFFKNRITGAISKVSCYIYISFFIIMNVYIVYNLPKLYDPLK